MRINGLLVLAITSTLFSFDDAVEIDVRLLVRESTSVFVGTVVGETVKVAGDRKVGLAVLSPQRWLLFPGRKDSIVLLAWSERRSGNSQKVSYEGMQGRTGLWLLLDEVDGSVSGEHTGRLLKTVETERVTQEITRNPLRVVLARSPKQRETQLRFILSNP